jgi:hypothetical protein
LEVFTIAQYIHFTDEQKLRANSVDLAEFLRWQGEKLIPSGRDKRLDSDHSITVRGNQWYDHATGEGGLAIDFVQRFYGLSFPDAVTRLLGGEHGDVYIPARKKPEPERKPFALPPAHSDMHRVYAYLLQKRFIDREVLTAFAHDRLVYESREPSKDGKKEYHNAVFVGYDEHGVARHAHKRGLYTEGKSYRGNVDGCDPAYSFHYIGTSNRLYVFEAPIDLLSFVSLYPMDWKENSYVALCGISEHAMLKMLELHPHLKSVALCLDHDEAGIEATGRLYDILWNKGHEAAAVLRPQNKDWNEDLKAKRGLTPEPAEEHPQIMACAGICKRLASLSGEVKATHPELHLPGLLTQYKSHLLGGLLEKAADCMEQMAALSLSFAAREYRQMGDNVSMDNLCNLLKSRFRPYKNRGRPERRTDELAEKLRNALKQDSLAGIRGREQKEALAEAYLDVALGCAKVLARFEADAQKQEQKQIGIAMQ